MALNRKQELFIKEYLIDLNATQAALRAGYSPATSGSIGHELLKKPEIASAIELEMKNRAERLTITADMVLQQWWDIATADVNEIVYNRKVCCRYCFGIEHHYQWKDEEEFNKALMDEQRIAGLEERSPRHIDNYGGFDFDHTLRPHPKCPKCKGEGHEQMVIEDTRDLSHKAKLIYNGLKPGNAGMEVKIRDRDRALENVARYLGMYKHSAASPTVETESDGFMEAMESAAKGVWADEDA